LNTLTAEQIESYRRDGFLHAQPALTPQETMHYRSALQAYELELGAPLTALEPMRARKTHVLLPWVAELVRHRAIVDVVEDLIGPDILIFNATFFMKEAHTGDITDWHQDSTYFGLDPHDHVTAWIALSDASAHSGCMEFIPSSNNWGQLHHAAKVVANSINLGSQSVVENFDTSITSAAPLRAGQFSCHNTRTLHRSGPNNADDRRIGLGISYIPATVRHTGTPRMPATLVRGQDRCGHFDLEPDPRQLTPSEAQAAHEQSYRGYRAGYSEQMQRHVAAYEGEG
jgi:non-heme Fe2+,alpha-ketoglutarate-dependent halogenase